MISRVFLIFFISITVIMRYVGALTSFIYSLPALSLYGFGMLAEVVLGLDPIIGMFVLGGIALVYTLTGGFWAVALTIQYSL